MSNNAIFSSPDLVSFPRVPWTFSVSIHRFVWAIQFGVGVGTGSRVDCRRCALAVWLRKLAIYVSGCESGAPALSLDEQMLVWLVGFVRGGMTPKGVLLWLFPYFGDLLYLLIT